MTAATQRSSYLLERGFSPETIARLGWYVAPLGDKARDFGYSPAAKDALAWWIRYRDDRHTRVRLIRDADVQGFSDGRKYHGRKGGELGLYDPLEWIARRPARALLIEGEGNTGAVYEADPTIPVIGLPGKNALKVELATQLAAIPLVAVWLDPDKARDPHDEKQRRRQEHAERALGMTVARLYGAGVESVVTVADDGDSDANDLLRSLGRQRMAERLRQLLRGATKAERPEAKPASVWTPRPTVRLASTPVSRAVDELREVPADVYLATLRSGLEFRGDFALCPFHEEDTPSLHIFAPRESPGVKSRFYCHGCEASGDIFAAAAMCWGIELRGEGFKEIVDLLSSLLLGRRAA